MDLKPDSSPYLLRGLLSSFICKLEIMRPVNFCQPAGRDLACGRYCVSVYSLLYAELPQNRAFLFGLQVKVIWAAMMIFLTVSFPLWLSLSSDSTEVVKCIIRLEKEFYVGRFRGLQLQPLGNLVLSSFH